MRNLIFLLLFLPFVAGAQTEPPAYRELMRVYRTRPRFAPRTRGRRVNPLLGTRRHQEAPFNGSCPYYLDDDSVPSRERCIVGCVATSLEQVLTYYRYPESLRDTLHGWTTPHYTIADILPNTPIDWPHILTDYSGAYTDREAQAVADLSYMCGVAAHMDWGLQSSGANMHVAALPLHRAFGYGTVVALPRWLYTPNNWNAILRRELEAGRPICYTGHNMSMGGHAFNIDGVDEEGRYHINWGYDDAYNGWFDLDYLNPFEPADDATPLGLQQGFFCNQTALLLHPEDKTLNIRDSLPERAVCYGAAVDSVVLRREPTTGGYVVADCHLRNLTDDTLSFTFEALTTLPTDTAPFLQGDYVGLTTVHLPPRAHRVWPIYCQFTSEGRRLLSLSSDDSTFLYSAPVNVQRGTTPKVAFSEPTLYIEGDSATFTTTITNLSSSAFASDLITYCLFHAAAEDDTRHFQLLQLPPGEELTDTVVFRHLTSGDTYTLRVRYPWAVQQEMTFTFTTDGIQNSKVKIHNSEVYDLQGRPYTGRGIAIRNGKIVCKP